MLIYFFLKSNNQFINKYFIIRLNKRIYSCYVDRDFLLLVYMYLRGAFIEDIIEKCVFCESEDNRIEHFIFYLLF